MTDLIANLVDSVPTTGLAVGGAVVAIAVTFFAVKVLGSNPDSQSTLNLPTKKKKKRSAAPKKVSKKKASTDVESAADNNIITESKEINLQDFVADWPDSEEEEAARAEKKKQRRKAKKKKVKGVASAASDSEVTGKSFNGSGKDGEEGWETVSRKKTKAKK
ncbi:unnamed protein product [Albugo candida]|uniref:Uncharacterized protein n=1 Tax=Albugo candida TaxID=65357 RepID=A0A024GMU7_9STRA|nr:unnamed protein product [Albugo candida]|eukprot:CCI47669.1 unnamed protein product [Albugo candida]